MTTNYVLGFAFAGYASVALIRKARPEWQKGLLNGIGGHIEEGETPLQAMTREFKEETGYASELEWTSYGLLTEPDWTVALFCTNLKQMALLENKDKTELIQWCSVLSLPQLETIGNVPFLVHAAIDKLKNPKSFRTLQAWY